MQGAGEASSGPHRRRQKPDERTRRSTDHGQRPRPEESSAQTGEAFAQGQGGRAAGRRRPPGLRPLLPVPCTLPAEPKPDQDKGFLTEATQVSPPGQRAGRKGGLDPGGGGGQDPSTEGGHSCPLLPAPGTRRVRALPKLPSNLPSPPCWLWAARSRWGSAPPQQVGS